MSLDVRDLFTLTPDGDGVFVAAVGQRNFSGVVYGGQLLGQALAAASATAPADQFAQSMHAHFLAPGDAASPVRYRVSPLREGGSSSVWRVAARQDERLLFETTCAFSRPRDDFPWSHQRAAEMPAPPEACQDVVDFVHANTARLPEAAVRTFGARFPIERRLPDPEAFFFGGAVEPRRALWLRIPGAAGIDDPGLLRCLIAYLSDAWAARVSVATHTSIAEAPRTRIMSLDHALWIHDAAPVDDWLLYLAESPFAGHGRGLGRGLLYDRGGRLLASAAQECLIVPAH